MFGFCVADLLAQREQRSQKQRQSCLGYCDLPVFDTVSAVCKSDYSSWSSRRHLVLFETRLEQIIDNAGKNIMIF